MSKESSDSLHQVSGIGGIAVVSGVLCCIGLKIVGGAVLFGGLAATVGITTDQTTFLFGGLAGFLLAGILLTYRSSDFLEFV
ncbi:MAG: hypothetical protein ABEH59_02060 [Halobacteriales archaeon]